LALPEAATAAAAPADALGTLAAPFGVPAAGSVTGAVTGGAMNATNASVAALSAGEGAAWSAEAVARDIAPALHASAPSDDWMQALDRVAARMLESGQPEVWDQLTRCFESRLILAALASTRGRRIEAAQKLGIGRNTITRKIQELGLDAD